jgi:hypothetical protein
VTCDIYDITFGKAASGYVIGIHEQYAAFVMNPSIDIIPGIDGGIELVMAANFANTSWPGSRS